MDVTLRDVVRLISQVASFGFDVANALAWAIGWAVLTAWLLWGLGILRFTSSGS